MAGWSASSIRRRLSEAAIHRRALESMYGAAYRRVAKEHRLIGPHRQDHWNKYRRQWFHDWTGKCSCGEPERIGRPAYARHIEEWHASHLSDVLSAMVDRRRGESIEDAIRRLAEDGQAAEVGS